MTPARQSLALAIFAAVLAGCAAVPAPEPVTLPEPPIAGPDHPVLRDPSLTSRALMAHYAKLQTQMLTQNLLRSDGGAGAIVQTRAAFELRGEDVGRKPNPLEVANKLVVSPVRLKSTSSCRSDNIMTSQTLTIAGRI